MQKFFFVLRRLFLSFLIALGIMATLSSCGDNSSGKKNNIISDNDQSSDKWDEMVWDKDNWR